MTSAASRLARLARAMYNHTRQGVQGRDEADRYQAKGGKKHVLIVIDTRDKARRSENRRRACEPAHDMPGVRNSKIRTRSGCRFGHRNGFDKDPSLAFRSVRPSRRH
jgi:hypothetical protein